MAVRAVYKDQVHAVRALRYVWAEDCTLLLALDCCVPGSHPGMSFSELLRELSVLCHWQAAQKIVIGLREVLVEVVTLYHEFELPQNTSDTLMLICTPPAEYFGSAAA
jgi:hypothetical protein